jgi:predicted lactoylglutathione lyase
MQRGLAQVNVEMAIFHVCRRVCDTKKRDFGARSILRCRKAPLFCHFPTPAFSFSVTIFVSSVYLKQSKLKSTIMAKKIFINLPVSDLQKAMNFYTAMGFTNNPQFTDNSAACMVLTEEIYVMLLTHPKFKEFTAKAVADTSKTAAAINSISVDSAEEVNAIAQAAVKAGGKEPAPAKDYGFMQQRSIEDLDGNLWEVLYMDMTKFPGQSSNE